MTDKVPKIKFEKNIPRHFLAKISAGFTIMEVIITIAIFVVVLSVILFMYTNYGKTFLSQQAIVTAASSAHTSLEEIQEQALSAIQVLSSYTDPSTGTVYNSGSNVLVLQLPAITSTGDIVSGKYDYAVFYASGSNLYEIVRVDASSNRQAISKKLSDGLSSITFTYDSGTFSSVTNVTADIQTQKTARGITYTTHLSQLINLRN